MVVVTVDADRFKTRAFASLDSFAVKMGDARKAFEEIAEDFYKAEEENFRKQGSPQRFKALSPVYAEWKRNHFPGKTILRLHDNLYNALTNRQPEDETKARPIKEISPRRMRLGVESPYVKRQAKAGRKAVQITDATRKRWRKIMHDWAAETLRKELAK